MRVKLRPISQQVIFITGATSGIGLATVRMAVEKGAKVFMVARNEDGLQAIQDEMRDRNLPTAYAVADVAEIDQLAVAADQCLATFGRIDSWVNNAGMYLFGKVLDTNEDEAKRVFDTNFWGVVNGSKVAIDVLTHSGGGALINIGSVYSQVGVPMQGLYAASKHAVKGLTDSLRREVLADKLPISVTLIEPASVDTPVNEHAAGELKDSHQIGPVYHADVVARMILRSCETPVRELAVGVTAFLLPLLDKIMPKLEDQLWAKKLFQRDNKLIPHQTGNLFKIPWKEGSTSGHFPGKVRTSSISSELSLHPWIKRSLVISGISLLLFRSKKAH